MATINVIFTPTGQKGTIPEEEFDPNIYQRTDGQITQPTQTPTPGVQKGDSLIRNVAEAFVRPVRRFGELVGEAGFQAGKFLKSPELRKSVLGGELSPEEAEAVSKLETTKFIEPEKLGDRGDIAKEAVRRTAGAAALVLPAGATAKTAIGLGAVAGAGLAFGEEQDPLLGAAFGATGGVIGRAIGKVLGALAPKLRGAGEALRRGVAKPKVAPTAFFTEAEDQIVKGLGKLGIKGSARAQAEQIPGVMSRLSREIGKTLGKVKQTFNVKGMKNQILSLSDDNINFVPGDATYVKARERIMAKLKTSAGIRSTAQDLFDFKQTAGKRLKRAFDKQDLGTALTIAEAAEMSVWESIDSVLINIVPEVKVKTLMQSVLHRSAPGLKRSAEGAGAKIPLTGERVAGRLIQGTQDVAGRAFEKVGGVLEKVGIEDLAISAAPALQVGGRTVAGRLGEEPEAITPEEEAVDVATTGGGAQGQTSEDGLWRWTGTSWIPTQEHFRQMAVNDLQTTGGKNISKIETASKFIGGSQPTLELSDTAIKNVTDLQGSISDIVGIRESIQKSDVVGPISGLQALSPFSVKGKILQAEVDRVRQTVGKALEDGVLRKEDEEKYKKILPILTDPKEVAISKTVQLEKKLKEDLERYIELQRQFGGGAGQLQTLQPEEVGVAESLF